MSGTNGWKVLSEEEEEQARAFARTHAPDLRHWALYHPAYREEWRRYFGLAWADLLALPLARIPGVHDAPVEPPKAVRRGLPERDVRPPDVPPLPRLPDAGGEAMPSFLELLARGGVR